MDRYRHAPKYDGDVEHLVARDEPDLVLVVPLGALDAAVDGVGHFAGDLIKDIRVSGLRECLREGQWSNLGKSEARVEDGLPRPVAHTLDVRIVLDLIPIRPKERIHLGRPMLFRRLAPREHGDR